MKAVLLNGVTPAEKVTLSDVKIFPTLNVRE